MKNRKKNTEVENRKPCATLKPEPNRVQPKSGTEPNALTARRRTALAALRSRLVFLLKVLVNGAGGTTSTATKSQRYRNTAPPPLVRRSIILALHHACQLPHLALALVGFVGAVAAALCSCGVTGGKVLSTTPYPALGTLHRRRHRILFASWLRFHFTSFCMTRATSAL